MNMLKRIGAIVCAIALIASVAVFESGSALAYTGGGKAGSGQIVDWGCDMSYYNTSGGTNYGLVDFQRMYNDGCHYVILRIGYEGSSSHTDTMDTTFVKLYNMARQVPGMGVGLYFYGLATTYAGAKQDAQWVMSKIEANNMYFEYPIYYDVEDSGQTALGNSAMTQLCLGWAETLEAGGYFPGVYGGGSQCINKLASSYTNKYDVWYALVKSSYVGAQYDPRTTTSYSTYCGMWQYKWYNTTANTPQYDGAWAKDSHGYFLDCDVAYKDYPAIITSQGLNNCTGGTLTSATKLGTYKVTASSLNVRAGTSTDYDVVDSLLKDDVVVVSELASNGWGKVVTPSGKTGWCSITSYGTYIGIDALGYTVGGGFGNASYSYKNDGSLQITNTSSATAAVDLTLPLSIGTATTPYINCQFTPSSGGYYFGITQAGSGYFMMRDCQSGDQLVKEDSAPFMTGTEKLQIKVSDWWKPDDDYRINTVRIYLQAGTSLTVNYFYFAADGDVVTSEAYNTHKTTTINTITLFDPAKISNISVNRSGGYSYNSGTLTVTADTDKGYEVAIDLNKTYRPEELPNLLINVQATTSFNVAVQVTTKNGDAWFTLGDDFFPSFGLSKSTTAIPAMNKTAALYFLGCYTWNSSLPTDGNSTIKRIKVTAGGQGSVTLSALQMAEDDVIRTFADGVQKSEHTDEVVTPVYKKGDIDNDGMVSTGDVRTILQSVIYNGTLDAAQTAAADYDGNGVVDTADVRRILAVITMTA
ncbi:MAG: SH3 domain-containing protein [Clostridia bacterium]|nr:SH3 domain-containing protein [Clostridia bacterium]